MLLFSWFHPLRKLERKRIQSLKQRALPEFLRNNLLKEYPGLSDGTENQEYICLDMETTGLCADKDQILSIGWVVIRNMRIDLSSSTHLIINSAAGVTAKSAVIHHLTPEMLKDGVTLDEAMLEFFTQSQGKVIVAHGCMVEESFIDHYLNERFNLSPLPLLWIDTLELERHLTSVTGGESTGDLRLSAARERYLLPEYVAHNALADSVSTAELFLAQMNRVYKEGKRCFGRLYRISRG